MLDIDTIVTPRPLRKDAARNRALLINSARDVFAERGLDATLDDVAHHAGLGVGTAYRHFANKYELLSALVDEMIQQFFASAEQALTIADPWQALVAFLEEILVRQVNDRGLRLVLMGIHDQDKFDDIHDRLGAMLGQLLDRAKLAGAVRSDLEPSDVGILIGMLCTAADVVGDVGPQLWRRYLTLCLDGLKPGGTTLPVAALSEPEYRKAVVSHKQSHLAAAARHGGAESGNRG